MRKIVNNKPSLILRIKWFFLGLFTPVQKWFQQLGSKESLITEEAVEAIMALAQPGDILLSYEFGRPTGKFIKGDYDHCALINNLKKVVDAVGDNFEAGKNIGGVRLNGLERWLYQMDGVCLIRPITPDPTINIKASQNANTFIGVGYDYKFKKGSETIYCSELAYLCYVTVFPKFLYYHEGDEILPQYYRDMCDEMSHHFELIFEFKGVKV